MIKAQNQTPAILLKGAAVLSSLWLTAACSNLDPTNSYEKQQEENERFSTTVSLLSVLAASNTRTNTSIHFDCNTNPYNKNILATSPNSKGGRNNALFPVNCATPGSPITTTPVTTWVGATSGSVAGSIITTDINDSSETGYAKLAFSPALATSAHDKALGIQITGNSSTNSISLGAGYHSLILIEVYADPLAAAIYRFYIYQPSDRLAADMNDSQYLSPIINIPILNGADIQEIRFYGTGAGQKIIANYVKLGSL